MREILNAIFYGLCQLSRHEREAGEVEPLELVYAAVSMPINSVNRA
jgi:hypothetical protein